MLYIEGSGFGEQCEAQSGEPAMYAGNRCNSLDGEPKLWKISLSGNHRRMRNGGYEATYHIRNDIHPQNFLVTNANHNYVVLGNEHDDSEYFIRSAGLNGERRFWGQDLLDGSAPDDGNSSIPIHISCASDEGASYLACDENNAIVRTATPYVWFIRRGRNSMTPKDVTHEVFSNMKSVFGIFAGF